MNNITTYIIRYIGETQGLKATEAQINTLRTSTQKLGLDSTKVSKVLSTDITSALDKEGNAIQRTIVKWQDFSGKLHTSVLQNNKVIKDTTASSQGLTENLSRLAGRALLTIPIWLALRSGIMGVIGAVGDAGKFLVELEDAFIDIRMVGNTTATELTMLKNTVLALGTAYGVTAKDSLEATKLFIQQGLSATETVDMVRAAMIGSQLLGASVTETAENLTAAMRAYKIETSDSLSVIDKWMAVQKNFAVTAKDLAEATKTGGATAAAFGIQYEAFLGHVTSIIEVTRRSGTQAANALQAIYTRLFSEAGKAVQEIGKVPIYLSDQKPTFAPTNIYREATDVIDDLAMSWKTLTEARKIQLATELGSRRQAAPTIALFETYDRAIKAQIEAYKSAGEAIRDWAIKQESATVKTKQMQASWAQLVATIGSTTPWKVTLDFLNSFAVALTVAINKAEGLAIVLRRLHEERLMMAKSDVAESEGLVNLYNLREKYQKKLTTAPETQKTNIQSFIDEINAAIGNRPLPTQPKLQFQRKNVINEEVQLEYAGMVGELASLQDEQKRLRGRAIQATSNIASTLTPEARAYQQKDIDAYKKNLERQKEINKFLEDETKKRVDNINIKEKDSKVSEDLLKTAEDSEASQTRYDAKAKEIMELIEHRAAVMRNLGTDEATVLKYMIEEYNNNEKLNRSTDAYLKKRQLAYQLAENEAKLIGDYANKLESAFGTMFKDLLMAEKDVGSIFTGLTDNVRDMFMGTVGESMSEGFMNATGLSDFFGGSMAKIRHMFGSPIKQAGGVLEDSIVTGAQRAAPILAAAMTSGATAAAATGGGAGGAASGGGGMMGAMFPFLNQKVTPPTGTTKSGNYLGGTEGAAGAMGNLTYGNLLGGITMGAMIGYSSYQSMANRGVNKGYAGAAGGLMGLGAGLTMIGMASQLYPLAGIGMLLMAVGGVMQMSAKGGTSTQISEQTKTEQKQVTSRIDITNKQLEIVNRNLISLREEMSYIMQQSYYFRERNLTDRFAIDSQRGNM